MEKGEYLEKLDYEYESHSYEKPLGFLKPRGTFEKTFKEKHPFSFQHISKCIKT